MFSIVFLDCILLVVSTPILWQVDGYDVDVCLFCFSI
jgi:hypothetical protein